MANQELESIGSYAPNSQLNRCANRERNPNMITLKNMIHAVATVLLVTAVSGCRTTLPGAGGPTTRRPYRGMSPDRFVSAVGQFPYEREPNEQARLKAEFRNLKLEDSQQAVEARLGEPDICSTVYTDDDIISFNSAWFLIKNAPHAHTIGDAIISVQYDPDLKVIGFQCEHRKQQ